MELKHSRTKGSKNGIRLYQNKDGTWTELGKERRRKDAGLFSRKQKSDEKETSSKKIDRTIPTISEERKQELLRSGDATWVRKNRRALTDQELRQAINRIKMENELKSLEPKVVDNGNKAVKRYNEIGGNVIKVSATTISLIKAYRKLSDSIVKDVIPNMAMIYGLLSR